MRGAPWKELETGNHLRVQSPPHERLRTRAPIWPPIRVASAHAAGLPSLRRHHGSPALFWSRVCALGLRRHRTLVNLDIERGRLRSGSGADREMVDALATRVPAHALGRRRGRDSRPGNRRSGGANGGRRGKNSEPGTRNTERCREGQVRDESADGRVRDPDGPDSGLLPGQRAERAFDIFSPADGFRAARPRFLVAAQLRQCRHLAGVLDVSWPRADVLGRTRLAAGKDREGTSRGEGRRAGGGRRFTGAPAAFAVGPLPEWRGACVGRNSSAAFRNFKTALAAAARFQ